MLASAAVAHADLRVLLMSVYHLTGDQRWLSDPYRPSPLVGDQREGSSSDQAGSSVRAGSGDQAASFDQAGLSHDAALRLRVVAAELIEMNIQPVINDPGTALLTEMLRWCVGDEVDSDRAAALRAELDFTQPTPSDLGADEFASLSDAQRHLAERLPHYATWTRVVARHR
ncbi:MAG: hypothetical protein R2710_19885 [Acidimicrobiales bacterium]